MNRRKRGNQHVLAQTVLVPSTRVEAWSGAESQAQVTCSPLYSRRAAQGNPF